MTPVVTPNWDPMVWFIIGALFNLFAWSFLCYSVVVRSLYWLSKEKEVEVHFDNVNGKVLTEDGCQVIYDTLSAIPFVYSKKKTNLLKKRFRYACKRDKKIVVRDLGFLGIYYASSPMGIGPFIVPVVLLFAWSLYW